MSIGVKRSMGRGWKGRKWRAVIRVARPMGGMEDTDRRVSIRFSMAG